MDRRTGVFLNVGEVLAGQAPQIQFEINFRLDERTEIAKVTSPIKGTAHFVKADDGVVGTFSVQTTMTLLCSIDGEEFQDPFHLNFHHEFRKNAGAQERQYPDTSPILPDNTIDVLPAIRDEILVNVPMKPLCPKHQE